MINQVNKLLRKVRGIRDFTNAVKIKEQNKKLIGVEIGVLEGQNSYSFLKNLNIKKLYLVDPYATYENYKEDYWRNDDKIFNAEDKMYRKLKIFENKVKHIKKYSKEAIKEIPNNLDFVYIDGNHAYKYVMEDIKYYYPKVRKGGIIGGHDFNSSLLPEVFYAVMDFANKYNLHIYFGGSEWWFIKGENRKENLNLI